jgi:hypothetical protein
MLQQVYLGNLPEVIEVILPLVLAAVWMRVGKFSPARESLPTPWRLAGRRAPARSKSLMKADPGPAPFER